MKNVLIAVICGTITMFSSSLSLSKHSEVVILGSVAVDFVAYTTALPQIGETVFGTSFAKNFGGKGANQVTSSIWFRFGGQYECLNCCSDKRLLTAHLYKTEFKGCSMCSPWHRCQHVWMYWRRQLR